MTRMVEFGETGALKLINAYGEVVREFAPTSSIPLAPTPARASYTFNGESFAICEGEGALYYRDYPQALSFQELDPQELENYLLKKQLSKDPAQRLLIQQFLAVYNKNIAKGCLYLNPPFFLEIEMELLKW